MPEGVGEKGFAHAARPDDRDMRVAVEKAQRRELIEERLVEGHLGGRIPGFQMHGGIQVGLLHAQRDCQAVAAGGFIAEDEQQPVLMRHFLLPRQHQALGQGVQDPRQAEPAQNGFQIGTDDLGGHSDSPPSDEGAAGRSGSAY